MAISKCKFRCRKAETSHVCVVRYKRKYVLRKGEDNLIMDTDH